MSKIKGEVSDHDVATPGYEGSDRRAPDNGDSRTKPIVTVDQDARGSTVLSVTTVTPTRRKDDDTVNLENLLEVDSLSIDGDERLDVNSAEDDPGS